MEGTSKRNRRPPSLLDTRKKVLRELMTAPEGEQKEKIRDAFFGFFYEDLKIGRLNAIENEAKPTNGSEKVIQRNVYAMVLALIKVMPEKRKPLGKILTKRILENLENWLEQNEEVRQEFLTEHIKQNAVFTGSLDLEFSDLFCKVFQITQEMLDTEVASKMDDFYNNREFKEASDLAIHNKIVGKYSFERLVFPLVLQDKLQVAYELMAVEPRFQKDYVAFLDGLVDLNDTQIEEFFEPYKASGLLRVTLDRFKESGFHAHVNKFFNHAVRQYGWDLSAERDAPNFSRKAKRKALLYLPKSRYGQRETEKSMSDEVYYQNVKIQLSKSDPEFIRMFLDYLWNSDYTIRETQVDALGWISSLNIPKESIPAEIIAFLADPDEKMIKEAEALVEIRKNLQYPAPGEKLFVRSGNDAPIPIHMICTVEELNELCQKLRSMDEEEGEQVYVGFDSECKPSHVHDAKLMKLALVQLFFRGEVWIIDCVEMEKAEMSEELWHKFANCLFGASRMKIIGFDVRNDLDAFLTIPGLRSVLDVEKITSALCLKRFAEQLCDIDMDILKLEKNTFKLSVLCEKILGRELDKSEQQSNWLERPLRTSQLIYSAMDAVVVMQLFAAILEKVRQNGTLDIEKLLNAATVMGSIQEDAQKKWERKNTIPWEEIYNNISLHCDPSKPLMKPSEFKILLDPMFVCLERTLCLLGMDVESPRSVIAFREALERKDETSEKRYVVASVTRTHASLAELGDRLIAIRSFYNEPFLKQLIKFFQQVNINVNSNDDLTRRFYESGRSPAADKILQNMYDNIGKILLQNFSLL